MAFTALSARPVAATPRLRVAAPRFPLRSCASLSEGASGVVFQPFQPFEEPA